MKASLRTKWTLVLLVLGALPVALLAWISLGIQRRGLENSERALGLAIIDQVGHGLDEQLDQVVAASHWTGRLLSEAGIANGEVRLDLAREAIASSPAVSQVAVYDVDGRLIDAIRKANSEAAPPAQSLPAPLRQSTRGGGTWVAPEPADADGLQRYLEPLQAEGKPRGFLLSTLDGAMLSSLLEDVSRARFDDPGRILLLDRSLRVIVGGDPSREPPGKTMRQEDVFASAAIPAQAFTSGFALTAEYRAPTGEDMVATLRTLPARGWAIIVRRPIREAYAALATARRGLIGAAALFAGLALAAGIWLGRRNTRPIATLVDLTRAYASRKLEARAQIHTGDELEMLGRSMEEMADALQSSGAEIVRRARVEANLSRYLPATVAHSISEGSAEIRLGGERRPVSVLFADVVSFTPFAESSPPEQVVAFLNQLFTTLTEVVFRHQGTVDKFIGDCVMAVFGAPHAQADHAARAVAAAEDMQRFVEAQAPAWQKEFGFEVRLGIGIGSGEAVVGNLGSESRMEYTVIGDVVNVAARLEAMARPGQILVTEQVSREAGSGFRFTSLGQAELRGKRQPVAILELA
jgi:class 3 adenylate cyclase